MPATPGHVQLAQFLWKPEFPTRPTAGISVTVPSTFWLAIRDARVASGRDADTGERIELEPKTMWLGAIAYLILFDQIGDAVSRPSRQVEGGGILRALALFSDLPEAERKALYALRCAFAHDYSLVHNRGSAKHLFRVVWEDDVPLVQLPSSTWSGRYDDLSEDTTVNLLALTELGESVVKGVIDAYSEGDLELAVSVVEADHRYFVTIMDDV